MTTLRKTLGEALRRAPRERLIAPLLLLVLAVLVVSGGMNADPTPYGWHQEAGNAQHTGYAPYDLSGPWQFRWQWNGSCNSPLGSDCRPGDPQQGWSFEIPARSHPVAGDGCLYLPAGGRGVYAIREANGETAWHNDGITSNVTGAFDPETRALFVAGMDGRLYKLSPTDGSVQGSFQADAALDLAPIVVGGRVYVVSDRGTLYAIDKYSMSQVWAYAGNSRGQTPAAYSARRDVLVFATEDLYVHAVSNTDGHQVWRRKPTPNEPGEPCYDGGDGRRYRKYNYEHGWPVIAEEHGIVFVRLHQPNQDILSAAYWPTSNDAIRQHLQSNPRLQTLFALRLDDGGTAFIPAVGPGGIDTPELNDGSTLGPLPVVRSVGGAEVAYMIWRNGQKCEAGDCTDARWDAVMGEMVLDDNSVPGYHAGDLRFIDFKSERDFLISDEMGSLTVSGDTIFHAHWLALYSYRMTDRSASRGDSYGNPISTERRPPIVNRGSSEPDWVTYSPGPNHHADGTIIQAHREGRTFQDAFWVFFNALDPPYAGGNTYGDGYKGRYAIIHDGTIYYQTNGGSIFAVGTGSSGSVYVPPDDEPGTNPPPADPPPSNPPPTSPPLGAHQIHLPALLRRG